MICHLKEDILEELDLLKDLFIGNGFSEHLVTKTLNELGPREFLKAVRKGIQQGVKVEDDKDFLRFYTRCMLRGSEKVYKGS